MTQSSIHALIAFSFSVGFYHLAISAGASNTLGHTVLLFAFATAGAVCNLAFFLFVWKALRTT